MTQANIPGPTGVASSDEDEECDGGATCQITTEEQCLAQGGVFQGAGTACFDPAGNPVCAVGDEGDDEGGGPGPGIETEVDSSSGGGSSGHVDPSFNNNTGIPQGASSTDSKAAVEREPDHAGKRKPAGGTPAAPGTVMLISTTCRP